MTDTKTSKRVTFKEEPEVAVVLDNTTSLTPNDNDSKTKNKHTLDSDEEEDEEVERLDDEDIEGQEEATIEEDDGIKITPFNIQEELEEGYFDSEGSYIYNKPEAEIRDNWLDNVDWVAVKRDGKKPEDDEASDDDSEEDKPQVDKSAIYKKMLEFLMPGETVLQAIRRLGGGKNKALTASQRLKLKKKGLLSAEEDKESSANRAKMLELSGLADSLISVGDMDSYQLASEKLSALVSVTPAKIELDMFADEIAEDPVPAKRPKLQENEDQVEWFYKAENVDSAEIKGPFTSEQMLSWSESAWPGDITQVFVAKCRDAKEFYSSARIDFDLYL